MVSNISISEREMTTTKIFESTAKKPCPANMEEKPENIAPSEKEIYSSNIGPIFIEKLSGRTVTPSGIPAAVAARMPMTMPPLIRLALQTAMMSRPSSATTAERAPEPAENSEKLTTPTRVASLLMTMPPFTRPIKAMKRPMPAEIATLRLWGRERTIASRRPSSEITRNRTPEMKTMARPSA